MKLIYVIIVIIFIVTIESSYDISSIVEKCNWKPYNKKSSSKRKLDVCKERINILKQLNLKYFICFGSELGAVRENNIIKNDKDIDICAPIWMNQHIFNCKSLTYITIKNDINLYLDESFLLCNKSRNEYNIMLERYIRSRIQNITIRRLNVVLSIWYKELYLDFYVMMSNEYIYRKINICSCSLCEMNVNCLENSIENVINYYGKNYLIPSNSVGKPRVIYYSSNNTLGSILDYKFYYIK